MSEITNLEPGRVFYYFDEICKIPHGSRHTDAISDYLVGFAKEHNLKYRQDKLGNVIVWKDGKGDKPVIIQGHMDMVCEKAPDCEKDMDKEGLDVYIDGDVIRAKGTTLGGDDGIAVASALALLESDDEKLPPLEVIITVDEEIGMLGAAGLDCSDVKGRVMLNMDSEDEGIFTVSCAGGVVADCSINIIREETAADYYEITISKLVGGHSGIEIHKNRANAIRLLGRMLQRLSDDIGIRLVDVTGGAKDNAIAVSSKAVIAVNDTSLGEIEEVISLLRKDFATEYATSDPDIEIIVQAIEHVPFCEGSDKKLSPMTMESTDKVIYMLACMPNGIIRMSPDVDGLVQTSLNMGILSCKRDLLSREDSVVLAYCLRSSVASEKDMMMRRLRDMMHVIGGSVVFEGDYPGWQYAVESPLRDLMCEIYTEKFGSKPEVVAIHAGVECGYFADKLPGLDCVSYGPNLSEIHTFRESMEIESVRRTYELTLETLYRLAEL